MHALHPPLASGPHRTAPTPGQLPPSSPPRCARPTHPRLPPTTWLILQRPRALMRGSRCTRPASHAPWPSALHFFCSHSTHDRQNWNRPARPSLTQQPCLRLCSRPTALAMADSPFAPSSSRHQGEPFLPLSFPAVTSLSLFGRTAWQPAGAASTVARQPASAVRAAVRPASAEPPRARRLACHLACG
jgi:hypothetical protein